MTTIAILPAGTKVSFQAGSLHITGNVTRYDAQEQGYYILDCIGCVWFRSEPEFTVQRVPSWQERLETARQRDSHSAQYMALRMVSLALTYRSQEQGVDYLAYCYANRAENGADGAILQEAMASLRS